MSELIRREDVRREIQASFDGGAFRWQDGQDLMDRINALPTVSPWHRVEDGLPDKTTTVLVWVGVNYDGMGMYPEMRTALWHTVSKHFFVHHDESIRGPIIGNVTHWMPLPEPPKEDA